MAVTTLTRTDASANNTLLGKRRMGVFVLSGGMYTDSTYKTVYGALIPDITTMDAPTGEPVNEREVYEMGFRPSQTNDGVDWSLTLQLEGNSRRTVGWFIGQYMPDASVIELGKDYGVKGHLLLYNVDENDRLLTCDVLLDLGVKLMQLPGGENGENMFEVMLYSKDAKVLTVADKHPISFEFFYDNGTTEVNADAPDGSITTFTLGDGNRSYATKAPPTALRKVDVSAAASGKLAEYFLWLRLDGRDVTDAEATFNSSTKVLTFATAPANGAKLEMGYIVDNSGVGPLGMPAHLHAASSFLTTPEVFMA